MPIYDYKCKSCQDVFDVYKTIANADIIETCPHCQAECDKTHRIISGHEFYGEKPEEPFFSVPLGKWVKGKNDMRRQAKQRGLIEIGNENIETLNDRADRDQQKRDRERWSEFTNPDSYKVRGA